MNKVVIGIAIALLAGFMLGSGWKPSGQAAQQQAAPAKAARKILYYRNPMGLPDTSPTPKKDSMGMDYIPVYEGEEAAVSGVVTLTPEKVQKLGVRTAAVVGGSLTRTVRASGVIAVNETRHYTIAPKFEGWIEQLNIDQTGAAVRRGQTLAEIYSPELVSAQQEYVIATRALHALAAAGGAERETMQALADATLRRLRNWDIPAREVESLRRGGAVRRTLVIASPADGVVLEKRAVEGMRFMPGEMLFDLAGLSDVWLLADVSALDLADVRVGQAVRFTTPALPGREFLGSVAFIYPTMTEATRTVKVRVVLPNADGSLRPALFGQVEIATGGGQRRVLVPVSAVLDSGVRQTVLVALDGGRFQSRDVRLGQRGDDAVEVLEGVAEGEEVVVAANFLIDAESNLKSALGTLGGHSGHGGTSPAAAGDATAHAGHEAQSVAQPAPAPGADAHAGNAQEGH